MSAWNVVFYGILTVLLFDISAAWGSRAFKIPYAAASLGTFLIYLSAGYVVTPQSGTKTVAMVGAALGLFDATAGWAISRSLRANTPEVELTPVRVFATVILMCLLAAGLAVVGASVHSLR